MDSNKYTAGKFVKESYDSYDLIGKQLLVAYLVKRGHIIKPETFDEDYGVDILTEFKGKEFKFEVEFKRYSFNDKESFPFDTVSFLGRKEKWKKHKYIYCIISEQTKAAVFCESDIIFNDEYRQVINIDIESRSGFDLFYRVPKELCTFRTPKEFYNPTYKNIWQKLKEKL